MTLDKEQNIFLVTSVIISLKNQTVSTKTCYDIITVFVQRCMRVDSLFIATMHKSLLALRLFYCCVSSVEKFYLGTVKCHDYDI